MKPILDISSPVAQRFASLALFGQMQKIFNLHPAGIAHAINAMARQRSVAPLQLVHPTKEKVLNILSECLSDLMLIVRGESPTRYTVPDRETLDLKLHFNLDPYILDNEIKRLVRGEEMCSGYVVEMVVWLQEHAPLAFSWAFANTERVLRIEAEEEDE